MIINKKRYLSIFLLIGIILLINTASAFAVSSQYWKENPIKIHPGQTQEVYVVLQNSGGDAPLTVKAEIIQGGEIANISDESNVYEVGIGQRVNVNLILSVPEDAEISSDYQLILNFVASTKEGDQTMGLESAIQKELPVIIVQEPKEVPKISGKWVYYLVAGIIILIIIIPIILRKKKKKKRK
jgi:acyl-CoA synthetase (NDP forming)